MRRPPRVGTFRTAAMCCPGVSDCRYSLLSPRLMGSFNPQQPGWCQERLFCRVWGEVVGTDSPQRQEARVPHCWGIYISKGPSSLRADEHILLGVLSNPAYHSLSAGGKCSVCTCPCLPPPPLSPIPAAEDFVEVNLRQLSCRTRRGTSAVLRPLLL